MNFSFKEVTGVMIQLHKSKVRYWFGFPFHMASNVLTFPLAHLLIVIKQPMSIVANQTAPNWFIGFDSQSHTFILAKSEFFTV